MMRESSDLLSDIPNETACKKDTMNVLLTGFRLLDSIVDKYATESSATSNTAMMEKSVLLSALSQQTAMLMSKPDGPWFKSLNSIVHNAKEDIDSLIEALKCINADLQLVQLVDSSSTSPETQKLMTSLRRHVNASDNCETAMVFYQLRHTSSTCQEIIDLLKNVEKDQNQTEIADGIKGLLCGKLLVLFAKRIVVDAQKGDDRIPRVQRLLADTLYYYLSAELERSMSSFYLNLREMLDEKQEKKQTVGQMEKSLMELAFKQLTLVDLDKISSDKINRKQIIFILHHVPDVSPAVLDKLLQWAVENEDEEMIGSVQQVFDERHWKPVWNNIRSLVENGKFKEEINRLEAALGWKYCSLSSYQQKMQLCSGLEEKLLQRVQSADNLSNQVNEWITKQETQIIGCCFEDKNQLKSSFFQLFRQLRCHQNVHQEIRRALYIYNQIPFDCTDDIQELNQLFKDMNPEILRMCQNMKEDDSLSLQKDWSDLKNEHRKYWASNYLRRRFDSIKTNNKKQMEEIAKIIAGIQEKTRSSSRLIVTILLNKYLYFTSKNLSPAKSLQNWQSLTEIPNIDKPDKLREEIQKRLAGKSMVNVDEFISMNASDKLLLHELDASIESNHLALLDKEIDSLYDEMRRLVNSLQFLMEKQQETNILFDFVTDLEDQGMNVSDLQKKRTTIHHFYVSSCVKLAKIPGNVKDPAVLVTTLLQLCSQATECNDEDTKLRLSIVFELCEKLELSSIETTKEWTKMLDRVSSTRCRDQVLKVQLAIIKLCQSFCLSDENNKDGLTLMESEHCIDELTIISDFLAGSDTYQANRLLLSGLLIHAENQEHQNKMGQKSIQEFMLGFVNQVRKNDTIFENSVQKTTIVTFIYSPELSTRIESAFLKRWIQTKASADTKNVAIIYNLINEKPNTLNRFWGRVDDIWTLEEEQYVDIIGMEVATRHLQDKSPVDYLALLKKVTAQETKELLTQLCNSSDTEDVRQFHEQFDRSHSSAREDGFECQWIIWIRDVVIKSIQSSNRLTMAFVGHLLSVVQDHSFEHLLRTTLSSRPHQWIDNLLIGSVIESACTMYDVQTLEKSEMDLHIFIKRLGGPAKKLLYVLQNQLDDEEELKHQRNEKDLESFQKLLATFKTLDQVPDRFINRFNCLPLSRWPKRVRHLQLSNQWSESLANRLTKLDCRLGTNTTDRFLDLFNQRLASESMDKKKKKLNAILKNLFKYTWLFEELAMVMSETSDSKEKIRIWNLLQDEQAIKNEMKCTESGSSDLKDWEIIRKLVNNRQLDEQLLLDQMKRIKIERKAGRLQLGKWLEEIKNGQMKTVDVVTFLSLACIVVEKMEKYYPRDTQLVAVLILAGSSDRKMSCMAEIATGEGKTLITALLAIYLSLSSRGKNGTGCVNVVTSSPVLAEENVAAVSKLFQEFRVSVGNNCDQECSGDDDERRERYKNDVIYGDLASFQHDELIVCSCGRDVTRNRKADAVIVDEVDSMLLDKGENILYLSHKIPELDDLSQIFVEIWQSIHAPDITAKFVGGKFTADGKEKAIGLVVTYIRQRIEDAEINVPVCLRDFVDRQLSIWTASALRAKYCVTTDDSYKLDDLRDGLGQQLVIMDKETGVEQVQMHWSHGLHQFLQLKHSLKLSPISLKAVFMSNISYFNQFKGRLFGLTGTLGSEAECRLLHDVFDVTFLKMPRFKRRFCSELDPLLAPTLDQWLDNVNRATFQQLDEKRSVLIVCENIAAVQFIVKKLENSKKDNNKIRAYTSSFDKEFQKEQLERKLEPGEVIVATNLAGRGTDLKISRQLEENGGLHVIISYVPPNARVEAQAQGRTARAGQPGTYQFVVGCEINQSQGDDDAEAMAASELQRLKEERDEREAIRLERLGTKGLDRIKLEEKLFERFRLEILGPSVKEMQKEDLKEKEKYIKYQLEFLTNKWALWLDGNSRDIEDATSNDRRQVISDRFDNFKKDCLQTATCQTNTIKFASTPTELVKLGRHFSELEDWCIAGKCFQLVIDGEPNHCESALIHQAHKILQTQDKTNEKLEAKRLLAKSKMLMQQKIQVLSSSSEIVKLIIKLSRKSFAMNQNNQTRFDEQVKNLISLYNIHIMAIDDILGRPLRRAIELQFQKPEEVEALCDVIVNQSGLCKGMRLSKKLVVDEKDMRINQLNKRKTIEWPSAWSYCRAEMLETIRNQLKKSFDIKRDIFHQVVVTRNILWDILKKENLLQKQIKAPEKMIALPNEFDRYKTSLAKHFNEQNGKVFDKTLFQKLLAITAEKANSLIAFLEKEGVIVQEVFSYEWQIKVTEETDFDLPKEWIDCKSVLIDYLKKHNNQTFDRQSIQKLFKLNTKQMDSLDKILKEKSFVQQVQTCRGFINKEATSDVEQLPGNLKRFQEILSAWLKSCESDEKSPNIVVCRDTLRLPTDIEEGARQMWKYLMDEGVIKEPSLIFPKIANASETIIKSRLEEIKKVINGMAGIEPLCRQFTPTPAAAADDYEPGFSDVLSYLRANPSVLLKYGILGINLFGLDFKLLETVLKAERDSVKSWLKKTKEKESLEAYVNQVVAAVTGSAGQLKTFPAAVSASFRNLEQNFTSGRYPPEVDDFQVQLLNKVIVLKEYTSWWDWRAFSVAMIGTFQIAAGVAINFISAGVLSPVGAGLIGEGVSDIMFAIQTGLTGTFSWSAYGKQKMISVGITVLTAGIANYMTWSKEIAKTAWATCKLRCGQAMIFAAAKKILCKIGQTARSAFIALGVEKLMAYLKKLIVDHILDYIRSHLIDVAAMGAIGKLTKAMTNIWKSTGGNVEESKRIIRAAVLVDASTDNMHSTWFNQMSTNATQLGRAMGNAFAESSRELKFQSGFLDSVGQAKLGAKDSTGNDLLNLAKDALDMSKQVGKIVEAGESAMKWIGYLKNGSEVATIITHTPEYIHNIGRQLENQAHSLEMQKESLNHQNIPNESEEFQHFKSEMTTKVERDVMNHVVSRINSAWVQPLVQRLVEKEVQKKSQKAIELIGSLFEDDLDGLDKQRGRVGKDDVDKNKKASSKNKKNKSRFKRNQLCDDDPPKDESYDEQVKKIGQGDPAGLLEFQQTADYCEIPITIDDPTGTLTANSKDGKFTIKPNGREPKANGPRMHLKVSQNDDNTKHVSLTDSSGNSIYEGSPDGLNRCLYEAAAHHRGVSSEEFLTGLKAHAANNDRARYLFERGVSKAMPEARVGAMKENNKKLVQNNTTYEKVSVYCRETDSYETKERPVRSDVWIKPENLGQGTATDEKVRAPSKEENKKSQYVNQAGHFVPKSAGGSGTDPNNIFIQDKRFNQVENNLFDNHWKSDLKAHSNFSARLTHELEYDNASSMKADRVTITARIYSSDESGNLRRRGKVQETFNNYHWKSLNDLPARRAVNEELKKKFKKE